MYFQFNGLNKVLRKFKLFDGELSGVLVDGIPHDYLNMKQRWIIRSSNSGGNFIQCSCQCSRLFSHVVYSV